LPLTTASPDARAQPITMHKLRAEIERLYATGSLPVEVAGQARQVFQEFREP